MSLKERIYKILLISSRDTFSSSFEALLPPTRYQLSYTATSINSAKQILTEHSFDFVIINSPLTDDTGIRFAMDTCERSQIVVLLLIRHDIHTEIHDKVTENGVFTLPKPTSKATLLQALGWMESVRERFRIFEKKSLSIEDKMAEIRIVNKAKWILISELNMSEPDAHYYIEKKSMDQCISKRTVAEEIIRTYS